MYVTHSSSNGLEAEAGTKESSADLMAKLMGDWSWRPQMQPEDPGYVWTPEQVAKLNEVLEQGVEVVHTNKTYRGRCRPRLQVLPLQRWMVPAYDGADLVMKPVRIGPRF